MKKSLSIIGLAALLLINASAATLITDPFNYTTGNALSGDNGNSWTNTSANITVASGNLSYPSYAASSGNMVSVVGGGSAQDSAIGFSSTNSGTIYYSFLLNVSSLSSGASNYALAELKTTTGGTAYDTLFYSRVSSSSYNLGLGQGVTNGNGSIYSGATLSTGATALVVVGYTFVAGSNNDTVSLWVNPSSSTFSAASAPTANFTYTNTSDPTALSAFAFRATSVTTNFNADELRVATSWSEAVVPEPKTWVMIGIGTSFMLWNLRRKRNLVG